MTLRKTELLEEEEKKQSIVIEDEEAVADYWEYRRQLDEMSADFKDVITHPNYCLPFLQPGRLLKVKWQKFDFGWGVIINYQKRVPAKVRDWFEVTFTIPLTLSQGRPVPKPDEWSPHESYIVDVLVNCQQGSSASKNQLSMTPTPGGIQPCEAGQKGEPQVVPILLTAIEAFSHLRIFLPKDIRQQEARDTVWKSVLEVQRRLPEGIGLLDPVKNMGIKDEKFLELIKVCSAVPRFWRN